MKHIFSLLFLIIVTYSIQSQNTNSTVNDSIVKDSVKTKSKVNELQTVEIVGRSTKKYNSDYSFAATKTAALNKDIPQSISTVTKELIADKAAFYLADAVKMTSGVIP